MARKVSRTLVRPDRPGVLPPLALPRRAIDRVRRRLMPRLPALLPRLRAPVTGTAWYHPRRPRPDGQLTTFAHPNALPTLAVPSLAGRRRDRCHYRRPARYLVFWWLPVGVRRHRATATRRYRDPSVRHPPGPAADEGPGCQQRAVVAAYDPYCQGVSRARRRPVRPARPCRVPTAARKRGFFVTDQPPGRTVAC